jgi:hypothetical protein
MSVLVALSVVAAMSASASATFVGGDTREVFKKIERNLP